MTTASRDHSTNPNSRRLLLVAATPLLLLLGFALLPRLLPADPQDPGLSPLEAMNARRTAGGGRIIPRRPPPLKPASAETQHRIERAVEGQISAFRKGDYAAALRFSSPSFRPGWEPDGFRSMIWGGFRQLPLSTRTKFDRAQAGADRAVIQATVIDRAGSRTVFVYTLMRERGEWFVIGCSPMYAHPPGSGAPPIDARDV